MTKNLLPQLHDITCIVASNDMAAWGCIDTLRANGLSVPREISVTGADGLCFPGDVRIDSFGLPSQEIGRRGAQLLLEMLNENYSVASVLLPVKQVKGTTFVPYRAATRGFLNSCGQISGVFSWIGLRQYLPHLRA